MSIIFVSLIYTGTDSYCEAAYAFLICKDNILDFKAFSAHR